MSKRLHVGDSAAKWRYTSADVFRPSMTIAATGVNNSTRVLYTTNTHGKLSYNRKE